MKRELSFAVCVLLGVQVLAGCGQSAADGSSAGGTDAETAAVTPAVTEPLYEPDDLPALDFGGKTVSTFGWSGPVNPEFFVESTNGDIVNDALYRRNSDVEQRLNIKLDYHLEPGDNPHLTPWVNSVSKNILSGEGAFDIVAGYSMGSATLAQKHYLCDLNSLDYLNFEKPWWSDSLQNEAVCGDQLFFCSGDIATSMIYNLFAVYFNKQLLREYQLENPYQLVSEGKWTIDKMKEMSSAINVDLNGNNERDKEDLYGLAMQVLYSDAMFYGIGLLCTERNAEGMPVPAKDFGGEKAADFLKYQVEWYDQPYVYMDNTLEAYDDINRMFAEGRALFTCVEFEYSVNWLREAKLEYGIVPPPKYDESQESYYTVMSFPYSLYGVPVDAKEPDTSAAVLECLASESYRTVSPMLFEVGYKVKYAPDDEAAKMFDLIKSSAVYDFGRIFCTSLDDTTVLKYRTAVNERKTDWMSIYASMEKTLNKYLAKLIEDLNSAE